MAMMEDYITLPMSEWEEYKKVRRDLSKSHEKRRRHLRRCRATLAAWDKAFQMTLDFGAQDVSHGKQFGLLLQGMREIVLQEVLEWDKANVEEDE